MVLYGQIIIGAPGSGKTTYCDGMQQYLKLLGRECYVVNLDPANEMPATGDCSGDDGRGHANTQLPYETIFDVCEDVISLDSVVSDLGLGPNGGLLYCMEYVELHLGEVLSILKERLELYPGESADPERRNISSSSRAYLLFDLPGQIELTAHSNVIARIAQRLVRELDLRLACVQLVDAAICLTDVSKFIGAALVCTSSMMRLELPCVNVLSKMDLLQSSSHMQAKCRMESDDSCHYDDCFGSSPLPFNLEFFTQCHNLHRLVDYLDYNPMEFMADQHSASVGVFDFSEDPEYREAQRRTHSSNFNQKHRKLHIELCDVVEDFSLLSFLPLSIQDAESVGRVAARVDKCNGYVFLNKHIGCGGGSDLNKTKGNVDMLSSALVSDSEWAMGVLSDVQEKYLGGAVFREDIAELNDAGDSVAFKEQKDRYRKN